MNNCTEHSSMFTHLHGRSKRSVNNDHGNVGACRRHAGKPDLVADRGIDRWLPGRGSDARRGLRHRRGYHRWPHWGLHRRMVVWPAWREHRRWSAGQHYYGFYWCLYLDFPPASFFASLSVPETVSRPRGGAARGSAVLVASRRLLLAAISPTAHPGTTTPSGTAWAGVHQTRQRMGRDSTCLFTLKP